MSPLHPRIALVAASLDILGGQAVQARVLHEHLQADGWDVDFVPVNPRFPAGLRFLRDVRYVRTLLNQALYLPSLARLRDSDVVHILCASYWSFLLAAAPALLVARALRKRVILNYHSGEAADHLANWGALVHPWLRLADEIVVPSEFLADVFARQGYRARVVHNVVDLTRFPYRARSTLRPALFSNRNFERHYRVDNNLRAFALLRERHGDALLVVAGQGSEEPQLRTLASSLGLDGVRFAGRVAPEAMPALYDQADVFVNSSVVDNQPLSILEAFAAGVPVVSTATGAIASMVRDGETGAIVAPDDPEAMAKAIDDLLSHPAQAGRMAERARDQLHAFSWPSTRDGWFEVYRGTDP